MKNQRKQFWISEILYLGLCLLRISGYTMVHDSLQLAYYIMMYMLLAYSLYQYRTMKQTWLHPVVILFLHIGLFFIIALDIWIAIPLFLVFPIVHQRHLVWNVLCGISYILLLVWLSLAMLVKLTTTQTEVYRMQSPRTNRFMYIEAYDQGALGVDHSIVVVDTFNNLIQYKRRYELDDRELSYETIQWIDENTLQVAKLIIMIP